MHLYTLRHLKGRDDIYRDQISTKDGSLRLRKVTGSDRDYGADESFLSKALCDDPGGILRAWNQLHPLSVTRRLTSRDH